MIINKNNKSKKLKDNKKLNNKIAKYYKVKKIIFFIIHNNYKNKTFKKATYLT